MCCQLSASGTQIDIVEEFDSEYGAPIEGANLSGSMTAFFDEHENVKTVVVLKKNIKCSLPTTDAKYHLKIAALAHELGHVKDLEQGLNFQISNGKASFDVIEAEAFAHIHALEWLATNHIKHSYETLYDALSDAAEAKSGLQSKIAKMVMDRHPRKELVDWNLYFTPPSESEFSQLSVYARRSLKTTFSS